MRSKGSRPASDEPDVPLFAANDALAHPSHLFHHSPPMRRQRVDQRVVPTLIESNHADLRMAREVSLCHAHRNGVVLKSMDDRDRDAWRNHLRGIHVRTRRRICAEESAHRVVTEMEFICALQIGSRSKRDASMQRRVLETCSCPQREMPACRVTHQHERTIAMRR